VVISRALDMPEGATLSDADDDRDRLDEDDPHRALGDIIFDDYKITPAEFESRPSNQIEIGGMFAPADSGKTKKKKKKEKEKKEEKKSKKKKDKKEKESSEPVVKEAKNDGMDIDFWLDTSGQQTNGNDVSQPAAAAAAEDAEEPEKEHKKKKKKEKKEKKEKKHKKEKKENGGIDDDVSEHYRHLATNKDLKIYVELRKVPLDPDKLAAAVQVIQVCFNSSVADALGLYSHHFIFFGTYACAK
jgi:hypothetical protein